MKINKLPKVQFCFLNISACKNLSKMVQYSKRTYGCNFPYETDPNLCEFFFWGEIRQNLGAIGHKTLEPILRGFGKLIYSRKKTKFLLIC